MAKLASLWIGGELSPLAQVSAASFAAQNDDLIIYSYKPLQSLPKGVENRDALEVWNESRILRFRNGSPAPHADLFRYRLMRETERTWVDLDIIALRSFEFGNDYVFGLQDERVVGSGVLRLPGDSRTTQALNELSLDTVGYPKHFSMARKAKWQIRTGFKGLPIAEWRWAWTGPYLLTHLLKIHGEFQHALPKETFYKVDDVRKFLEPDGLRVESYSSDCYGAHFWGSQIRSLLRSDFSDIIPKDSFLGWAMQEFLKVSAPASHAC